MSNWIHYLITVVFIIFGLIQINDPDFWIWTPLYLLVAIIPILFIRNTLSQMLLLLLILLYTIYLLFYVPDILDWINGGMENIAGKMKAEEPHIELAREFFGLLICVVTLISYYFLNKSKTQ